jgi:ketosteroid isomerase-like protein
VDGAYLASCEKPVEDRSVRLLLDHEEDPMPTIQPQVETTFEQQAANKEVVRGILQAFHSGDVDAIEALTSPTLIDHSPVRGIPPGPGAIKQQIEAVHRAFKDVKFEEQTCLADGDVVFLCWRMTGTHERKMPGGSDRTHQQVEWFGHEIVRVSGGQIVEHQDYFEDRSTLSLVKQRQ